MPEPTELPTEPDATEPQESATEGSNSSLAGRLKLLLFAVGIVVVECVVAYLYIPTASGDSGVAKAQGDKAESEFGLAEGDKAKQEEQVEVDLGEYTVTSFQPISNTTLRIDFHLFGTIASKDIDAFNTAMEGNIHRLRDQVIVTVRSSELTDLTDAGLGLIKRKILEKVNRTLGRPFLEMVVFSDFSFIEQ